MMGMPQVPNVFMPNNQASSSMQQGGMSGKKATLYLFTPKNLSDQVRRPHLYKFSTPFINDLQNTIEDTARRGVNANMNAFMVGSASAPTAISPDANGIPIAMNHIRELWTFILIVDNHTDPTSMYVTSSIKNRVIYSGYCTDEPIGLGIYGQVPPPNPYCCFVVTHRTAVNSHEQMAPAGIIQNVHTVSNADFLPASHIIQSAPTNEMYNLSPKIVNRSIVEDPYSNTVSHAIGSHGLLQTSEEHGNPVLAAELASPRHHLQFMANAIQNSKLQTEPLAASEDHMSILGSGMSLQEYAFDSYISTDTPATMYDPIQCDKPITFGNLLQIYTDLNIIDCRSTFNSPWSDQTISQYAPTAHNVANSILASSVPYLLSDFGLCDLSFRYNSWMTDGISPTRGMDQVESISSLVPMPDDKKYQRYKNFLERMKLLIFPMLEQMQGPFDLMMNCSLAGPSVIHLHYMDNAQTHGGFYETNNMLGGFNSPLVGDNRALTNNTGELANLRNSLLEVKPEYLQHFGQQQHWG